MWFKRKNQIDISIEKNANLNTDGEFTNLSDATKNKPKRKLSEKFKEFSNESKKTFKSSMVSTKDYFKTNKYFFYKSWLTLLSVYIIAFTFTMGLFPFSYFKTSAGVPTTLTNFYYYDGSAMTLSAPGIAYIISLILVIIFWVVEKFMYNKHETYKITKEMAKENKTAKAFNIMKYVAWISLIVGLSLMLVLILVPPSIDAFNKMVDNQAFVNSVYAQVSSSATIQQADIDRLNSIFPGYNITSSNISNFFRDQTVWKQSSFNNLLTFYTMYNGGVSELNNTGLILMSLASTFSIIGVICFIVKWFNNFVNTHEANLEWLVKWKTNMNADSTVKSDSLNLGSKVKGFYANTQARYEGKKNELKNRDSFKKYKKRLIEEGKDTNSDNFTTDVKGSEEVKANKESIFSVLKSMRQEKKQAQKDAAAAAGKVDKNRMKPAKPEIAIPDDELDEIIDSLDIK